MKRCILLIALAAMAGPDRDSISAVEKAIDRRIETLFDEPFLLLGMTRGVYLEGTGAVFTAELGLALSPAGPFAQKLTPEHMARLRKIRLERLPIVREAMRDMMIRSAEMLPAVPESEDVVLGVTIFRRAAEDNSGIPAQIVMQAERKALLAKDKSAIRERDF
jgi:hypothetical protein